METIKTNYFYLAALSVMFCSCGGAQTPNAGASDTTITGNGTIVIDTTEILESPILTQEQQRALTPEGVLNLLKEGNEDFVNDRLTIRNSSARIRKAALGQHPKAVILSCVDSRVPVEDVFHRGIGDIFVGRVAGNIVNAEMLGSMEFGCRVSGAKLILVLGHEHCGAIKSAIEDVKLGNITALLARIRPAVTSVPFNGDKTSKNDAFVHAVCEQNVRLTVENIRKNSPILTEMEKNKEIMILGAVYDMNSGKVAFL